MLLLEIITSNWQSYVTENCFVFSEVKEKLQESFANISDSFLVLQFVFLFRLNIQIIKGQLKFTYIKPISEIYY